MNKIPIIPRNKNYWLVRTQSGKYYNEFKRGNFIGVNWNEITFEDIESMTEDDIKLKILNNHPETKRIGTSIKQLRVFANVIKKGDSVVITGPNSNEFSVGEIENDIPYTAEVSEEQLLENPNLCPYSKRRKVKWINEYTKWDVEISMFKLLQHAQHTITDAEDYKDVIESMIHDFYIREDGLGYISLEVRKEEDIPTRAFFAMGNELLDLVEEFGRYSSIDINLDQVSTKINVNSRGKIKLKGTYVTILAIGLIFVGLAGGGINVDIPEAVGGGTYEIQMNSLIHEVSDFLDRRQERIQEDMLLEKYIHDLDVKTPEELAKLIETFDETSDIPDKENE
ncbi:hypothetical protein [Pseudalkalibacillus hwajinpoensis]|uniref:hypothetical protein n=1 Tax=Guptibacillus hwajinpoensis TaxID=208199 RepID=UPI001CD3B629|nr:hypothetical protein [Pseudalkalibacillus hwajinpoensis]MCA0990291.1 hypothetical protein [Pseudalkalibacillus hwajinpoensis]